MGSELYGVFPIRGKLLNVRAVADDVLRQNETLASIVKILGLRYGEAYDTPERRRRLRYGHVMLMCDQDDDGSHIKGLLINFLHAHWPSLLRHDGFLQYFITPIVKVMPLRGGGGGGAAANPHPPAAAAAAAAETEQQSRETKVFFTRPQYDAWRDGRTDLHRWRSKYYKGLGTSTPEEAREYFAAIDAHRLRYLPLRKVRNDVSYTDLAS